MSNEQMSNEQLRHKLHHATERVNPAERDKSVCDCAEDAIFHLRRHGFLSEAEVDRIRRRIQKWAAKRQA
jgi:hypothetical protein